MPTFIQNIVVKVFHTILKHLGLIEENKYLVLPKNKALRFIALMGLIIGILLVVMIFFEAQSFIFSKIFK